MLLHNFRRKTPTLKTKAIIEKKSIVGFNTMSFPIHFRFFNFYLVFMLLITLSTLIYFLILHTRTCILLEI